MCEVKHTKYGMPVRPSTFSFQGKPSKTVSFKLGYDSQYRKVREQVIREEPLCRVCLANGWTTPTAQIDHIKPLAEGGTHDRGNLQGICLEHHKEKTAKEMKRQRRT